MTADGAVVSSRGSARLADLIRGQILDGEYRAGSLLPSERVLAREHGMGSRTVRRALKILESEALVAAEDRRGYRVLSKAHDPERGCPLAFVASELPTRDPIKGGFFQTMLAELQRAASARQWSLLGVGSEGRTPGEVVEHLRTARAGGAIVDSIDADLLGAIRKAGIPTVIADAWLEDAGFDGILQDGFTGGIQAAAYLASRGHERVGWLGLEIAGDRSQMVLERFSGAVGGLARAGLRIAEEHLVEVPEGDEVSSLSAARALLGSPDRPTAVIAPWQGTGSSIVKAADELGLRLGTDLEMVGWSTLEQYETEYVQRFVNQPVQPAVIWSVREMAEVCIIRLAQRRADPGLPVTKTRIPTQLRLP